MLPLDQVKHVMRAHLRGLHPAIHPEWGEWLADRVMQSGLIEPGQVVGGFWPFPWEIDIRPLLYRLHEGGWPILLPETPREPAPLIFRIWQPGAMLEKGPAGTWHPTGAVMRPDLLLVPMLAFDRCGHRLGYGAGYYDRTLEALEPIPTIGCAWSGQEMASIPVAAHDRRLDVIVTECDVLTCRLAE